MCHFYELTVQLPEFSTVFLNVHSLAVSVYDTVLIPTLFKKVSLTAVIPFILYK